MSANRSFATTAPSITGDDDKLIELYVALPRKDRNVTGLGLRQTALTALAEGMVAYMRESDREGDAENMTTSRVRYVTHRSLT